MTKKLSIICLILSATCLVCRAQENGDTAPHQKSFPQAGNNTAQLSDNTEPASNVVENLNLPEPPLPPPPPPEPKLLDGDAEGEPEAPSSAGLQDNPANGNPENGENNAVLDGGDSSASDAAQPGIQQANLADSADTQSEKSETTPTAPDDSGDPLVISLLQRNPFGNSLLQSQDSQSQQTAVPEPPQGLELRSIYCVDGKWYFGIADTKLKTFYTIPLGAKHGDSIPYSVDFYDDETNSISITNDLGSYTLSLKERDKLTGTLPNMVPQAAATKPKAPQPPKQQTQIVRRTNNTTTQRSNQR